MQVIQAKKWLITVRVRQRGAIGIFEQKTFEVEMPEGINLKEHHNRMKFFDAWYEKFGKQWECQGITSIEPA